MWLPTVYRRRLIVSVLSLCTSGLALFLVNRAYSNNAFEGRAHPSFRRLFGTSLPETEEATVPLWRHPHCASQLISPQRGLVSSRTQPEDETKAPAYVITPTYKRTTQEVDLVRLCHTLMNVQRLIWIVVEDSNTKTELVTRLLSECAGPTIIHLNALTPGITRHRGVSQRNAGLAWVRECAPPGRHAGGVYFADDDNAYHTRLFDAVRKTQNVSMWKVAFAGGLRAEGPVCSKGKVVGWNTAYRPGRTFPVDMAAFALGVNVILDHPSVRFQSDWQHGNLETSFLKAFGLTVADIQPGADENCTQVLAWHIRTVPGTTLRH